MDSFLDTPDGWFMSHGWWIKARKCGDSLTVSAKYTFPMKNHELSYIERTMPLSSLTEFSQSIREAHGEKEEFKLKIFAVLEIDRHEYCLKSGLTLRIDATRFAKEDYYLIGSIQSSQDSIEASIQQIEPVLETSFGPVRSKIIEYMCCYQPEIYSSLSLPSYQWFSSHDLNRFHHSPMSKISEQEKESQEIDKYFKLLGIEDRNHFLLLASESKQSLLQILQNCHELCEQYVKEGIIKYRTDEVNLSKLLG